MSTTKRPALYVTAAKLNALASGDLESREHNELKMKLFDASYRAADRAVCKGEDRAAANEKGSATRIAIAAAHEQGIIARASRRDAELSRLNTAIRDARLMPGTHEHELAVMVGSRS